MIFKENKLFSAILIIFALFLIGGCSRTNETESQQIFTEQFYSKTQLSILLMREFRIAPVLPDESYQLVDENSLDNFYTYYKKDLFDKGVTNWEQNFDCNRFSEYYASLSQIIYFKESYKTNRAEALAIGEIYYVSKNGGGHAVNLIITQSKIIFIEPQTGEKINLTQKEKESIFFIKI